MNCVLCKQGTTRTDHVTVTLDRDATTVIIREVPADVCENCGEYYLASDVTAQVLALAEDAVRKGVVIEIVRYAA